MAAAKRKKPPAVVVRDMRGIEAEQSGVREIAQIPVALKPPLAAVESAAERAIEDAKRIEVLKKKVSPPGALQLPPLLDEMRCSYLIPDGVFEAACAWDRIYVYQVSDKKADTFVEGGTIIMPDAVKDREKEKSPRGVLVGAGLPALDHLRSNGIDLGHMVRFIRLSPWYMEVDNVRGVPIHVMVMRDGDITGSITLREQILKNEVTVGYDKDAKQHLYKNKDGSEYLPQVPFMPADY